MSDLHLDFLSDSGLADQLAALKQTRRVDYVNDWRTSLMIFPFGKVKSISLASRLEFLTSTL